MANIKALQSNMRELQQSVAALGSDKHFSEFNEIVLRPGFTTKIDEFFLNAMISTMQHQVRGITNQLDSLMAGARLIVEADAGGDPPIIKGHP